MSDIDRCSAEREKWGVVNTHAHKENLAIENLQRQKFQTYCPFIRKRITHARRTREVLRPLFPNYLFVRIDEVTQRWQSISSTLGVRSLISCGGRLSFLHHDFIDSLRSREVDGAIAPPKQTFTVGQRVRLSGGAYEGLVATIIEMSEKDRLVVLMDLLNRPVKVKLKLGEIAVSADNGQ